MPRIFTSLLFVLPILSGCAGTMKHMTTYHEAAASFATDACGQFCWSREASKSGRENCANEEASTPLQECVDQLSRVGNHFVDKELAQTRLRACMQKKHWWRITAFIVICD